MGRLDKLCNMCKPSVFFKLNACSLVCTAVLACGFFAIALPVQAMTRCELGGKLVNPDNGSETAGLTGTLRCKDTDTGLLQREQALRSGQYVGLERFYDRQGRLERERMVNERGNTDGFERSFWPNGQLRKDAVQVNGGDRGVARSYGDAGKLQRISFTLDRLVLASMAFDKDGKLTELTCPQTSVMPEDRKRCGFDGKVQSTLYQNGMRREVLTFDQGKLLAVTTYRNNNSLEPPAPQGEQVWGELSFQNGQRLHRIYNPTGNAAGKSVLREERLYEPGPSLQGVEYRVTSTQGRLQWSKAWGANAQLTEHIRYANGQPAFLERWYLNGVVKEKTTTTHEMGGSKSAQESYDAAGHLITRQNTLTVGTDGPQRVGTQQSFYPNGQTATEDTYSPIDDRGRTRLIARKQWNDTGKLLSNDEILKDGSNKRL